MNDDGTIPTEAFGGIPVQSIRLRIHEGDAVREELVEEDVFGIGSAEGNRIVITDATTSRFHLELTKREGFLRVRDCASTNGTVVNNVRFVDSSVDCSPPFTLRIGSARIEVSDGEIGFRPRGDDAPFGRLVGSADVMRHAYRTLRSVAGSDVSLLLQGESGTGKELAAQGVAELSRRSSGPFVTLDSGALSPQLLASQLFGHERGAFTGADRQHRGAFEQADGGTLFIDEVGELPMDLQPILLGVLERRTIRRVGGTQEIPVDVRLISATHRDLRARVNDGSFRLDLYYRLAAVSVRLPPLRERLSDLPELLGEIFKNFGVSPPPSPFDERPFIEQLAAHSWPGNVRELRNYVEGFLATKQLPELQAPVQAATPWQGGEIVPYKVAKGEAVSTFERTYLSHLIAAAEGNIRQAARLAKTDRNYLTQLLRRHGLVPPKR